ncbi:hypothetical protein L4D76_28100 [Photobacterium sagamiensis]|uniref:hypothetical protein n=1 Tax=Photobacterium sagamiensis TaxID=2910241 RepID=UPI003D0BF98D
MWDEVKALVAKAAPLASTLLGGPAETAVGAMIASALGVENEPDAITSAIKNDPESAIKLRQMEIDNQLELKRLTLRYAELQMQENANAREMQVEALSRMIGSASDSYITWLVSGASTRSTWHAERSGRYVAGRAASHGRQTAARAGTACAGYARNGREGGQIRK